MVVYANALERASRARMGEFDQATLYEAHRSIQADAIRWLGHWMGSREYRDARSVDRELLSVLFKLAATLGQRSILEETDPVGQDTTHPASALYRALRDLRDRLSAEVASATNRLAADPAWRDQDSAPREARPLSIELTSPNHLQVGSTEQLSEEFPARTVAVWRSEIDALP